MLNINDVMQVSDFVIDCCFWGGLLFESGIHRGFNVQLAKTKLVHKYLIHLEVKQIR